MLELELSPSTGKGALAQKATIEKGLGLFWKLLVGYFHHTQIRDVESSCSANALNLCSLASEKQLEWTARMLRGKRGLIFPPQCYSKHRAGNAVVKSDGDISEARKRDLQSLNKPKAD